jgi:hypothetical protein
MKKNFADDYIEWEKYMNLNSLNQGRLKRDKKCPDCGKIFEDLSSGKFSVSVVSWKGQTVVRGMPEVKYYLRIDDNTNRIMSWELQGNPLLGLPISAIYEGRISKKWLKYTGPLKPLTEYNPNKKLIANVMMLDLGTVDITIEETNGIVTYNLDFKGIDLKKKLVLVQEQTGSDMYVLDSI